MEIDALRRSLDRGDTAAIGMAYAEMLRAERDGVPIDESLESWLMVVWNGLLPDITDLESLEEETWLEIVFAAASSIENEDDLWRLADGPVDNLVGEYPTAMAKLRAAQASQPGIGRMFEVMRRYHRQMGFEDPSWWTEED